LIDAAIFLGKWPVCLQWDTASSKISRLPLGRRVNASPMAEQSGRPGRFFEPETVSNWIEMMKTFFAKPHEVRCDWYVVDATNKTLGRLSTEIARRLKGKHKPEYTPHVDTGDYIVVVNAEKIRVTGNKMQDKMYHRHTGYIGNLKSMSLEKLMQEAPERALQFAVKGMLPRNSLGRKMLSKLRVFAGPEHPHEAQQPIPLEINV